MRQGNMGHFFMQVGVKGNSQWFAGKSNKRCGGALKRLASQQRRNNLYFTLSLPGTDAGKLPNISPTQLDKLMADLLAAAAACERAITEASHDDGARAWERWWRYCKFIGCNDPFLDRFSQISEISCSEH
jgi:hypothetical protein